MDYKLLDSGLGQKLEKFGDVTLIRPAPVALWRPSLGKEEWDRAHALFSREPKNRWTLFKQIPQLWQIKVDNTNLVLKRTAFGHLGFFPEHVSLWKLMVDRLRKGDRLLNLFAYTGGASCVAASAGAAVTHVDSAKNIVKWAQLNAHANNITSIRWLVDDVMKFLIRANRRKERYDAILLDPPSFGRGTTNEIFKIERSLPLLLKICFDLLSDKARFLILSCHTAGFSPIVLQQLLQEESGGKFSSGEMLLKGPNVIPSGSYAMWEG